MTTRPELVDMDSSRLLPGLAAVALFLVMAAAFVTARFGAPAGFPQGSVTASIGYAMFDLLDQAAIPSEGFLIAFEIIDVVLVAALAAAVMLARREGEGEPLEAYDESESEDESGTPGVAADGGRETADGGER